MQKLRLSLSRLPAMLGLTPSPPPVTVAAPLTLRARTRALTLDARDADLILFARSTALTVPDRPSADVE